MKEMLQKAVELQGSDIFIMPGAAVEVKVNNDLTELTSEKMTPADTERLIQEMYTLAHRDIKILEREGDDDFSFAIPNVSRFRCNTYRQRGSLAAICRIVKLNCRILRICAFPIWSWNWPHSGAAWSW